MVYSVYIGGWQSKILTGRMKHFCNGLTKTWGSTFMFYALYTLKIDFQNLEDFEVLFHI